MGQGHERTSIGGRVAARRDAGLAPRHADRGGLRRRYGTSSTSSSWRRIDDSPRSNDAGCSNATDTSPTAAWLANTFKMSWGVASDQVRVARALDEMPATRAAVEAGDVSMCSARSLVAARDADPTAFADAERHLVEAARIHSVGDLGRVVAHWRDVVERERGVDRDEALRSQRRLHASVTLHGMVRVDGMLDPETGETVLTALRAVTDAETRGRAKGDVDDRSPAQRRADALGEVCRQWLDRPDRPTVGGELPHHHRHRLGRCARRRRSGTPEMDHVGPISIGTARRLGCDASVMRVVLSEALGTTRRRSPLEGRAAAAASSRDRSAIDGAASPAATDRTRGAMRIMSSTGPTVARRHSRTSSCSAASTIARSTPVGPSWIWTMACPCSDDRTARVLTCITTRIII